MHANMYAINSLCESLANSYSYKYTQTSLFDQLEAHGCHTIVMAQEMIWGNHDTWDSPQSYLAGEYRNDQ